MACSKYILTNTGTTIVTFNYQRCDDALWQYQVELTPSETKNIWLLDNTYSTAFSSKIVLTNLGSFPFTSPTPTPSITASPTPTPPTTASVTSTPTPTKTPTNTPTNTQTPTNTATPTNTPTPTNVVRTALSSVCHDEISIVDVCNCVQTATLFVNGTNLADSTLAWSDAVGPNTGNPAGYYQEGGIIYIVSSDCGPGCVSGSTITVDGTCGPTPTPTNTQTPTPTPTNTQTPTNTSTPTPTVSRYSFSVGSGATSNEACSSGSLGTIWGDAPLFDNCTQFYPDSFGSSSMVAGFYVNLNIVTEIDSSGVQVGAFSACSVLPTPTPTQTTTQTPTQTSTMTPTPTQTFAWYTYSLGTGATSNDACTAFSASPQTIYGTVAGGIGPNVGEYLYETAGIPLTDAVPDGYYSNGVAWYQVSGGSGQITSSDPNGC